LRFRKIKPVGRQRLVRRTAAGLVDRVLARLKIVGDLGEALVGGFFGVWFKNDGCRSALPLPREERVGVRGF
jgi:hypothetical protein